MEEQTTGEPFSHGQERTRNKCTDVGFITIFLSLVFTIAITMFLSNKKSQRWNDVIDELKFGTITVESPIVTQLITTKEVNVTVGERNVSEDTSKADFKRVSDPSGNLTTTKPEIKNVIGWEKNVSRDTTKYINPVNDTTIISGKTICGNHTTLVIIVTAAPSELSKRNLIRETWASHNVSGVAIGFLVGATTNSTEQISIELESELYHDIIQEDIIDTYNNLSLKSIALVKWYIRNCPKSLFLMKSDSDTFVDVPLLVQYLKDGPKEELLEGFLCKHCWVFRASDERWAVPRYMYANKTYPNFLLGGAYVMTRDVAEKLFAAALKTTIFHLEDVYITGFCAKEAGVIPKPFEGSSNNVIKVQRDCKITHSMCHPIRGNRMKYLWNFRQNKTETIIATCDSKSVSDSSVEMTTRHEVEEVTGWEKNVSSETTTYTTQSCLLQQ